MPNEKKPARQPNGPDLVKQLAELMKEYDLSEVCLDTEVGRVRLRRGPLESPVSNVVVPQANSSPAKPQERAPEPAKSSKPLLEVKSEALGTFYCRPNPESEPYVKVGSRVTPTTVVGLIEAMKMFNEISAGVTGTIVEVLVENQQAVEYGTVLFKVDPS